MKTKIIDNNIYIVPLINELIFGTNSIELNLKNSIENYYIDLRSITVISSAGIKFLNDLIIEIRKFNKHVCIISFDGIKKVLDKSIISKIIQISAIPESKDIHNLNSVQLLEKDLLWCLTDGELNFE